MSRWSLERWLPRRAQTVLLALPVGTPAAARTAAARAAFVQALDTIDANAGSRIEVVLRDDLLRWQLLPWNAALSSAAQRVALARQAFVQTHGEAGRDWALCLEPARYGAATLACACDAPLLAALHDEARRRGAHVVRLRPLLSAWLNEQPRRAHSAAGWWVALHGGGVTLLLRRNGQPLHVRVCAGAAADPAAVWAREAFAFGSDVDERVCVIDGREEVERASAALPAGWQRLPRPALRSPTLATAAASAGPWAQAA